MVGHLNFRSLFFLNYDKIQDLLEGLVRLSMVFHLGEIWLDGDIKDVEPQVNLLVLRHNIIEEMEMKC